MEYGICRLLLDMIAIKLDGDVSGPYREALLDAQECVRRLSRFY
jgi:hypothetical protein